MCLEKWQCFHDEKVSLFWWVFLADQLPQDQTCKKKAAHLLRAGKL
jgi:hypothetical protein